MRKSLFATLFAAAVLLSACRSGSTADKSLQITAADVIHLDGTFDDNFLESWEYILLDESNPDACMPSVDAIFFDDDLFFLMSGKYNNTHSQIKVFDRNGKYLNDIGHMGRARNEYINICDWAINTHSNEIIVFDNHAWVLKRYDYKGEYLGQSPVPATDADSGFIGIDLVKSVSSGALMSQGFLCIIPSYDYYYIDSDGTRHSPLALSDYKAYCEMDPYEYMKLTGDIGGSGMTYCLSDQLSDTTYLLRFFDNHIYKVTPDTAQCLANMTFIPEIPRKVKYNFDHEAEEEYYGRSIPNYYYDMQKYLYIWYYHDNEYLYDKTTSKMYHMNHDSLHLSLPDVGPMTICGNTIIGCADDRSIEHALRRMDRPDYDHRYSPELEAFYRKVRHCESSPIIIAHYKSTE